MSQEVSAELPNPFVFEDGSPVRKADWARRRQELHDLAVGIEYGGMPPIPEKTGAELLHPTTVARWDKAGYNAYRVLTGPEPGFSFIMNLTIPPGEGAPFPVVINGDGCWKYVTDQIVEEVVVRRRMILAQFNRVEIAPDAYHSERDTGIYLAYPQGRYSALAAWAWGYHRCVDALLGLEMVDGERIGITGHSRGGKTTLLAGATDERITVTGVNNSGSGGAGCFRWQGPESEVLKDGIDAVPYWYGPEMPGYVGREAELPFDQHYLKALVAPRALLSCEAFGDPWANGEGTWQTFDAAREVYRWLGAEERIGIWYREGEHKHGWEDWVKFLDFMDWQTGRGPKPEGLNENPYPEMPRAFSWAAP